MRYYRSNVSQTPQSNRTSKGYYMNDSGLLVSAQPHQARPKFVYNSSTGNYDLTGYISEIAGKNLCPSSDISAWYTKLMNYSAGSGWTLEKVQMVGPFGYEMDVFKVTCPPQTAECKMPISYSMDRNTGNPCWSVFAKCDDSITSTFPIGLGVPGQSLQKFDLYTMQWIDDVWTNPTTGWNIYAGREVYANGWVRLGVGGICNAGHVTYNASFYTNKSGTTYYINDTAIYYLCLPCANQYEKHITLMSSYIDPLDTRAAD